MTDTTAKPVPFVLRMPSAFWWTVRVPVLADNDYQVAELDLRFKPVDQDRLDAFRGTGLKPGQPLITEAEICAEVVEGWRNMPDEHGDLIPFSPDGLQQLLRVPVVRAAIVATYLAAMSGMGARKNA